VARRCLDQANEIERLTVGASSAYLTVSETWPIEIRAEAIAVFFAIGSVAGALGPTSYRRDNGAPVRLEMRLLRPARWI
jgi:hypothetical protein